MTKCDDIRKLQFAYCTTNVHNTVVNLIKLFSLLVLLNYDIHDKNNNTDHPYNTYNNPQLLTKEKLPSGHQNSA